MVGVVGDVPVARLGESPRPMFYFSTRQRPSAPSYLVARTSGDPASILAPMRQPFSGAKPFNKLSAKPRSLSSTKPSGTNEG